MKVWFQNRRMKHKRQTLGKQGDDGDDKDSITSDGGKSTKMSDKFLDDEMSKKSCQGCEMPTAGLCGSHEEVPDLGSTRGNNNNTPSATNNNTSFNTNSNGASSVASSGSFDKIIAEDDSRSNEDNASSAQTSPRLKKPLKGDARRNSPVERKIALCKISPSASASGQQKEDKVSGAAKNMTPPAVLNANTLMYPHLPRSSPTTATAIASATVTIQNVPNNTSIPAFASRGTTNQFQNQYQMSANHAYRSEARAGKQQQPQPYQHQQVQGYTPQGDNSMYNPDHPTVNDSQPYTMRNQATSRLRGTATTRQYHAYPHNQYQYYNNKNHPNSANQNQNPNPNHNQSDAYVHGLTNQYGYQSTTAAEYNHYGYPAASMYPADGTDTMGAHMHNSVHLGHEHTNPYYPSESNMHHQMHKVEGSEYGSKTGYYDGTAYSATNADSSYIGSEVYQNSAAAIMTPPTSVQTDSSDTYSSFQQFYPGDGQQPQPQPQQQPQVTATAATVATVGENSNSSSDFNFLSNLANDYTPEYYQI